MTSKENYKELDCIGERLDRVVNTLIEKNNAGEEYYVEFNGNMLYSDTVTMDSAYLAVTGYTKAEHDEGERKEYEERAEKERKHKESIPKLTKQWIDRGEKVLSPDKLDEWKRCVPMRLNDLYEGMELGCTLDVIEALNNGATFEEAKQIVEGQHHSGMSFGLMCSMFRSFYDDGVRFAEYLRKDLK